MINLSYTINDIRNGHIAFVCKNSLLPGKKLLILTKLVI